MTLAIAQSFSFNDFRDKHLNKVLIKAFFFFCYKLYSNILKFMFVDYNVLFLT